MTESKAIAEVEKVADRYIAVWNELDKESQRHAVAELWTEDDTYTDPLSAVEGQQAIEGGSLASGSSSRVTSSG